MGKHQKVVNNDPILKKDYKYQKRRKQRAQQKQIERQQLLKDEKIKQQLAEIENEVDQEIQNELLKQATIRKQKKIQKLPKEMFAKKVLPKQNTIRPSTINKQVFILKNYEEGNLPDFYALHFGGLPERLKIAREHKESRKDIIDREVREQIKGMFSIQPNKQGHIMQPENKILNKVPKISSEDDNSNPFILIKSEGSKEREIILNNDQLNLFTQEAYLTKESLVTSQQDQDLRKAIINSYKDYVHIEDKEQSTIEQFRNIVIGHMVDHEKRCRKEDKNSKGFTNCKSLVLCAFAGDAKSILDIFQSKYQGYEIIDKERLNDIDDEDDFFKIGVSVNDRTKTIKYFTHFNVSNYIIGSPVCIKAIVGGTQGDSERDYSFMSSVQILYIDRASVISMQNWDHLTEVIKNLNMMPSPESLCNDITKLRPSVPELMSKIYRQSIVFSEFNFPEINGLKSTHFHNWEGCVTTKIYYSPLQDTRKTDFDIQFYKMDLKSPRQDLDMRFEFFKRKFWDEIYNSESMRKLVIFTRTYFQFLKIKEFLNRVNASADYISEHTKKQKVQSKISLFNNNKYRILLTTERAYYYGICQIKKFQHLYFYSLPRNNFIYGQLISEIYKQHPHVRNKVVAIYTKYDSMSLERIVGSKKAIEMVKEYCSNVSFVI